jgi:hypothetical protein
MHSDLADLFHGRRSAHRQALRIALQFGAGDDKPKPAAFGPWRQRKMRPFIEANYAPIPARRQQSCLVEGTSRGRGGVSPKMAMRKERLDGDAVPPHESRPE